MSKRSVFTSVTPFPHYITREMVVQTLHNHGAMIELNPLVIKYERCKPPPSAPPDEFHCVWYELTDKIHYLPGGILSGNVTYKACFHDLPTGLQTHVYAPTGLDIKDKWSVGGNMPGEPREAVELGLPDAPREGLYLREDINMRCNVFASSFVKKTLKKAHSVLVERLVHQADLLKQQSEAASVIAPVSPSVYSVHPSSVGSIYSPMSGFGSPAFNTQPTKPPPELSSADHTSMSHYHQSSEYDKKTAPSGHPALLSIQQPVSEIGVNPHLEHPNTAIKEESKNKPLNANRRSQSQTKYFELE
ncbi:hypothetical protein FQN57_001298 [Myotisia sp. PD_48]|nr:hypothetical protein FQN57_001298 [Myotisia sp. PD_48]